MNQILKRQLKKEKDAHDETKAQLESARNANIKLMRQVNQLKNQNDIWEHGSSSSNNVEALTRKIQLLEYRLQQEREQNGKLQQFHKLFNQYQPPKSQ